MSRPIPSAKSRSWIDLLGVSETVPCPPQNDRCSLIGSAAGRRFDRRDPNIVRTKPSSFPPRRGIGRGRAGASRGGAPGARRAADVAAQRDRDGKRGVLSERHWFRRIPRPRPAGRAEILVVL